MKLWLRKLKVNGFFEKKDFLDQKKTADSLNVIYRSERLTYDGHAHFKTRWRPATPGQLTSSWALQLRSAATLEVLEGQPDDAWVSRLGVFLGDPYHHYPSTWLSMARKQNWDADPYATGSPATSRYVHWTGCNQRNCALELQGRIKNECVIWNSRYETRLLCFDNNLDCLQTPTPDHDSANPPPYQKTTWDGRCYPGPHTALTSPNRRSTFLLRWPSREWKAMTTWTNSKVTSITFLTLSHQHEFFRKACASVGGQWLKLMVKLYYILD